MTQMPTWDGFMIYVLRYLSDGAVREISDIRQSVMDLAELPPDERAERVPSGELRAANRISWAVSSLARVGAIERPARARYRMAPLGTELLSQFPEGIEGTALKAFADPSDTYFFGKQGGNQLPVTVGGLEPTPLDPMEQIEEGLERITKDVAADLLQRLQTNSPTFFENAVVKLLVAMGYGGADGTATVTQQSNDGGIDGVIDRDALGLDRVYIQAKRYASGSSVQRPEVQAFVGALSGKASTGVFITTGSFSKGAVDYAQTAFTRIILIDGRRLTDLMIRYGVGVQTRQILKVVAVDEDFFE